jgi:hypothetical protein
LFDTMTRGSPRTEKAVPLRELEAEAQYASDRFRLYRARGYASRPTSPARLRELERKSKQAKGRLDRAKADERRSPDPR